MLCNALYIRVLKMGGVKFLFFLDKAGQDFL